MVTTLKQLGKLPHRVDVRTLSLGSYVERDVLPAPPAELDLSAPVVEWPMYGNDRTGDCTTAAAGHMIEAWTAAAAGSAVEVSEQAVLEAFDAVKIVDPETGEEGAIELDVLTLWRRQGIGGHRIGAFALVALDDRDLVRTAAYLFGGLYIGLQLPLSRARPAGLGLDGRLRRARRTRLVGRPRRRRRRLRRVGPDRRHVGRAAADDLELLGPLLRRVLVPRQHRLPRREREDAGGVRPRRARGRSPARHRRRAVSDRAALYTVAVRPKRGKEVPLGDIDGAGTSLQDVLVRILDGFAETSADGTRVVVAAVAARDADDLLAIVQHGVRGVAADIVDAERRRCASARPRTTCSSIRCGCLFRLPPAGTAGTLAVHVANGRGVKELFEQGLARAVPLALPGPRAGDRASRRARSAARRGRAEPRREGEPAAPRRGCDRRRRRQVGRRGRAGARRAGRRPGSPIQSRAARPLSRRRRRPRSTRSSGSPGSRSTARASACGSRTARGGSYDLAHPDAGARSRATSSGSSSTTTGEPTAPSLLGRAPRRARRVGSGREHRSIWPTTSGSRPSGSSPAHTGTSPAARTTS